MRGCCTRTKGDGRDQHRIDYNLPCPLVRILQISQIASTPNIRFAYLMDLGNSAAMSKRSQVGTECASRMLHEGLWYAEVAHLAKVKDHRRLEAMKVDHDCNLPRRSPYKSKPHDRSRGVTLGGKFPVLEASDIAPKRHALGVIICSCLHPGRHSDWSVRARHKASSQGPGSAVRRQSGTCA